MQPNRVMICEDEGLTMLRLRATLTSRGYEVAGTASCGEEAVAEAARLLPDAILMDIEMPGMDGLAALRRIMETHPTVVLMVSAYSEQETVRAALDAGAAGYLVKPVTDDQIVAALAAALVRLPGAVGM